MSVDKYEIDNELKLKKLRQLVDQGSEQIKRGESTRIKNKEELHKLFNEL